MDKRRGPRLVGVGEFGEWLTRRLKEEGLTATAFATMLKCSHQSITYHIRHIVKPSYITVVAYCHYLNASPIDVWQMIERDWA